MFIQLVPAARFVCTFMKTPFSSPATANRTLTALIYMLLKSHISQDYVVCLFFKDISCYFVCLIRRVDGMETKIRLHFVCIHSPYSLTILKNILISLVLQFFRHLSKTMQL